MNKNIINTVFYPIKNTLTTFLKSTKKVQTETFFTQNLLQTLKKISSDNKLITNNPKIFKRLKDLLPIELETNSHKYKHTKIGIGICEYLVARTGSIVVSSENGEFSFFGSMEHLIIIAKTNQIVDDISQALEKIYEKYPKIPEKISVITGPSRTADIEKTLILGMHGPKKLTVILIEKDF